jgi:hypothetical protein
MATSIRDAYPEEIGKKMEEWERQMGEIGLKLQRKDLSPNRRSSLSFHLNVLNQKMVEAISGFPS